MVSAVSRRSRSCRQSQAAAPARLGDGVCAVAAFARLTAFAREDASPPYVASLGVATGGIATSRGAGARAAWMARRRRRAAPSSSPPRSPRRSAVRLPSRFRPSRGEMAGATSVASAWNRERSLTAGCERPHYDASQREEGRGHGDGVPSIDRPRTQTRSRTARDDGRPRRDPQCRRVGHRRKCRPPGACQRGFGPSSADTRRRWLVAFRSPMKSGRRG